MCMCCKPEAHIITTIFIMPVGIWSVIERYVCRFKRAISIPWAVSGFVSAPIVIIIIITHAIPD